jgi:hypothetical protein
MTTGEILSTTSEIQTKISTARQNTETHMSNFMDKDTFTIRPGNALNINVQQNAGESLTLKEGLKTIKSQTPQFASLESFAVDQINLNSANVKSKGITDMKYTFGPDAIFSSNSLLKNDLGRVPAKNAEIEVSLVSTQGYVGPEFNRKYSNTQSVKVKPDGFSINPVKKLSKIPLHSDETEKTQEEKEYEVVLQLQQEIASKPVGKQISITTDEDGRAAIRLKTGEQAGKLGIIFRVIKNPSASGILPQQTVDFIINPAGNKPDNPDVLPTIEVVDPRSYMFTGVADVAVTPKNQPGAYRICLQSNIDGTLTKGDCEELYSVKIPKKISPDGLIPNISGKLTLTKKDDVITPTAPDGDSPGKILLHPKVKDEPLVLTPGLSTGSVNTEPETFEIPSDMLRDTDIEDSNYKNVDLPQADPSLCKEMCEEEPECTACTYVKPGIQGESARCYLKTDVTRKLTDPCCFSWIKNPGDSNDNAKTPLLTVNTGLISDTAGLESFETPSDMLRDTDIEDSNYKNVDLPQADPSLCKTMCEEEPECMACTYVKPGIQGESARCYLKTDVPKKITDTCCSSWIKNP